MCSTRYTEGMVTVSVDADYTFELAGNRFGFVDKTYSGFDTTWSATHAELGPLGLRAVPVSAAFAWGLVIVTLVAIIGFMAVFAAAEKNPPNLAGQRQQ